MRELRYKKLAQGQTATKWLSAGLGQGGMLAPGLCSEPPPLWGSKVYVILRALRENLLAHTATATQSLPLHFCPMTVQTESETITGPG